MKMQAPHITSTALSTPFGYRNVEEIKSGRTRNFVSFSMYNFVIFYSP